MMLTRGYPIKIDIGKGYLKMFPIPNSDLVAIHYLVDENDLTEEKIITKQHKGVLL